MWGCQLSTQMLSSESPVLLARASAPEVPTAENPAEKDKNLQSRSVLGTHTPQKTPQVSLECPPPEKPMEHVCGVLALRESRPQRVSRMPTAESKSCGCSGRGASRSWQSHIDPYRFATVMAAENVVLLLMHFHFNFVQFGTFLLTALVHIDSFVHFSGRAILVCDEEDEEVLGGKLEDALDIFRLTSYDGWHAIWLLLGFPELPEYSQDILEAQEWKAQSQCLRLCVLHTHDVPDVGEVQWLQNKSSPSCPD